ncbi:CwfJ-like family protein [Striga hermonthica]|uniref:CwfJ-like family protein n=1 Tax=Striga hermonthica TaxID=68872 RepID=A0A9N7ND58_STRHE|nr:CwfJ-like family protein [Striga hermonthica]
MLSGLKFIPRDQVDKAQDETHSDSSEETRKSGHRKEKGARKKKHSRLSSPHDEGLERIKSGSRKKKKWYDSNEDISSFSEDSSSQNELKRHKKKHRRSKKGKRRHDDSSDDKYESRSKAKSRGRRKDYTSDSEPSSGSGREKSHDDSKGSRPLNSNDIVRKEMGLEWMLRPKDNMENSFSNTPLIEPKEAVTEELRKDNPRELNPYLKNNGIGYPDESDDQKPGDQQLLSDTVVGDGGASWRLKALKRAQEQAARDGRKLEEVVEERWGSMGHLAASLASQNVAPTYAHLQAIKHRRKGLLMEEQKHMDEETSRNEKDSGQKSTRDVLRHPKMRIPKFHDSLSWGKQGNKNKLSAEDSALVSVALSSLNKSSNDGNLSAKSMPKENHSSKSSDPTNFEATAEPFENREDSGAIKPSMSANQLAAKAMQLRMKGKHEEAEKLLKEAEALRENQSVGDGPSTKRIDGTTSRFILHDASARQKKKEDNADLHLAQKIMHNHRYSISSQADEEYDYDDGPRKKARKKGGFSCHNKSSEITNSANRFLTQQDRCQFCFENPARPKHLVVAIANFTYLALPQQQPVVPGHCGILTLQHESSSRTVDDNVWDEIRNFKKCLIMMFAKQEKDVLFFETVMGLARQRRHCMVECVPLPRDIAKQAPVYFKKAIDEAEDEWSQHNAKKLIDTSEKGLRGSIPKNFPYFHVEFGLDRGFVHVIDDEKEFKSSFGLNVIRGMLQLPEEDMYRRRRHESFEAQKEAVSSFAQHWEPFDWTKQLD